MIGIFNTIKSPQTTMHAKELVLQETYFNQPENEVQSLWVNNIFKNSIYDCLILYKGKYLRRLKYYNDTQKTCFEKAIIFKGDKVKQVVKNFDYMAYKHYGDS